MWDNAGDNYKRTAQYVYSNIWKGPLPLAAPLYSLQQDEQ